MYKQSTLFLSSLFLLFTFGCASTPRHTNTQRVDGQIVMVRIEAANKMLEEGNPENALWNYEILLAEYRSDNGKLETAILTNAIIAAKQLVEHGKAQIFGKKLHQHSKQMPVLHTNTQIALVISNSGNSNSDYRVSRRVKDAIHNATGQTGAAR